MRAGSTLVESEKENHATCTEPRYKFVVLTTGNSIPPGWKNIDSQQTQRRWTRLWWKSLVRSPCVYASALKAARNPTPGRSLFSVASKTKQCFGPTFRERCTCAHQMQISLVAAKQSCPPDDSSSGHLEHQFSLLMRVSSSPNFLVPRQTGWVRPRRWCSFEASIVVFKQHGAHALYEQWNVRASEGSKANVPPSFRSTIDGVRVSIWTWQNKNLQAGLWNVCFALVKFDRGRDGSHCFRGGSFGWGSERRVAQVSPSGLTCCAQGAGQGAPLLVTYCSSFLIVTE